MTVDTLVAQEAPPKMLRLYKLPSGSGKYVFGSLLGPDGKPKYQDLNGKTISFIAGRYTTDDPREIEELDDQISKKFTNIVIDPREREIDSRATDPLFRLKEKIRQDIIKEMLANQGRDFGTYEQGKIVPASTDTIAAVTVNGSNAKANMDTVKTLLGQSV